MVGAGSEVKVREHSRDLELEVREGRPVYSLKPGYADVPFLE